MLRIKIHHAGTLLEDQFPGAWISQLEDIWTSTRRYLASQGYRHLGWRSARAVVCLLGVLLIVHDIALLIS